MLEFALYFSSEVDIHAKQSNASWIPTTSKLFLVLIFFQIQPNYIESAIGLKLRQGGVLARVIIIVFNHSW